MRCVAKRTVSALPNLIAGLAVLAIGNRAAVAGVSLQITSVTVSEQGQAGQICVALSTGGEQVAGTQNDLVWDGNCATLPSASSCQAAPSLNKQLQGGFPPQYDFTFRALVLSLGDVDPIPDGFLYCCAFQSEAAPGECCNIGIVRPGASDPKGNAIGVAGAGNGKICTAKGSGSGAGRGLGSMGNQQPLSASNAGSQPQAAAAPAPAAPAASGSAGGGAPAAAVLAGGGVRVAEAPPGAGAAPTPPAQLAPVAPTIAAPAAAAAAAATPWQRPIAPSAAATEPASPPTAAPTAPAVVETPTAARAPTVPPTAPATAAAPAAKAEQAKAAEHGGGWFGCQIGSHNSSPAAGFVVLLAAVLAMRRRRRASHRNRRPNQ